MVTQGDPELACQAEDDEKVALLPGLLPAPQPWIKPVSSFLISQGEGQLVQQTHSHTHWANISSTKNSRVGQGKSPCRASMPVKK
eukprot:193178-Pelagomonas_calceolata.AAC.1